MIGVLAGALAILAASLLIGRAFAALLGARRALGTEGAIGLALLILAVPLLIRLPGRGATAAVLIGLAALAAAVMLRGELRRPSRVPLLATTLALAAACLPFAFNEQVGVLGEGIYTNDQGAQLYWTEWLREGMGPEPRAVRFGYPVGPQAVVAAAAEATGTSVEDAFNGLLIAIPALTALAALGALGGLTPGRRVAGATLAGIPFLAASFLAQSGFKETIMGMLVLSLAVTLGAAGRELPRRAVLGIVAALAAGAMFTFSIPGLAWFGLALPLWMALEVALGRAPVRWSDLVEGLRRHWRVVAGTALLAGAVLALSFGGLSQFVDRIGAVQESFGRLQSPVFPGEALGVWPEGDFRIVRGRVEGAIPAALLGALAVGLGALTLLRRRETALVSVLAAAVLIYAAARPVTEVHVEAKALAVLAPIAALVAVRGLLLPGLRSGIGPGPGSRRAATLGRQLLGSVFVALAAASSFLALRAAPVGFAQHADELAELREIASGEPLAFLGLDRFSAYELRGTLVESPGGYVPPEVEPRPRKPWRQGEGIDFDTVPPVRLDRYRYAITTDAGYQSAPPPNFAVRARTDSFVLYERTGATPRLRVLPSENGRPGAVMRCSLPRVAELARGGGTATVWTRPPVTAGPGGWGKSFPRRAPERLTRTLALPRGDWRFSLQYHSQVPLLVRLVGPSGERRAVRLPPTLEGFYLSAPGRGPFWGAGRLRLRGPGPVEVTVGAERPSGPQRALGVERRLWLGSLAASPATGPRTESLTAACGRYVDHYLPAGGPGEG